MRFHGPALALALALAGCATQPTGKHSASGAVLEAATTASGPVAGIAGGLIALRELEMLEPQYLAGALVAYAIYDPLAPTWRIDIHEAGPDRVRMELRMKRLISGGEGDARQVFLRNARRMVEDGGFAGFDILRYEEGVESTRPFARRIASGEIRLVRSRTFPEL